MRSFLATLFCFMICSATFATPLIIENDDCKVSLSSNYDIITRVSKTQLHLVSKYDNLVLDLDPSISKSGVLVAHSTELSFYEFGEVMFSKRTGKMVIVDITSGSDIDITSYDVSCSGAKCAAPVTYWDREEIEKCDFVNKGIHALAQYFVK